MLWHSLVHPVGSGVTVSLAPLWRQVVRQLWREVRGAHSRANLPGIIDMAQYKLPDAKGMDTVVAYGIAAAPHNEAAVQGIHANALLLVVEEAGGICADHRRQPGRPAGGRRREDDRDWQPSHG